MQVHQSGLINARVNRHLLYAVQGLLMNSYRHLLWIVLIIPLQGMGKDSNANSTRFSAIAEFGRGITTFPYRVEKQ